MRWTTILVTALVAIPAIADDKPNDTSAKDEMKGRIQKYLEAGKTGVFYSETQDLKEGDFVRLFIVGRATISTVLGVDDGLQIAQERAEEAAKTAFVTFLNGKVSVRKTSNNQVILTKEGEEGTGNDKTREQGKMVEKRTKEFEESAGGLVRGLKVVAYEQKGADKSYVVVYRWEAKSAESARRADDKQNKPDSKPKDSAGAKNSDKTIPDKKVIIDD